MPTHRFRVRDVRPPLEMLASLGYVGSAVKTKNHTDLKDPKDMVAIYKAVERAGVAVAADQTDYAAELLRKVLLKEPHLPQAQLILSTCEGR